MPFWRKRGLSLLPDPQPLADLCDEIAHRASLRRNTWLWQSAKIRLPPAEAPAPRPLGRPSANKKPPFPGASRRADDGTRTHDLLHRKRAVGSAHLTRTSPASSRNDP